MKGHKTFKNPADGDESDLDELVDEEDAEVVIQFVGRLRDNDDEASSDGIEEDWIFGRDLVANGAESDNDVDYEVSEDDASDSDDSMTSSDDKINSERKSPQNQACSSNGKTDSTQGDGKSKATNDDANDGPSCSSGAKRNKNLKEQKPSTTEPKDGGASGDASGEEQRASVYDMDEDEEDDETVRAIIAAIKKPRTTPAEIKLEDFITDVCFHPEVDIIALGTITGDVVLYEYSNEQNTLLRTIEVHAKACRDVEFSEDGRNLLTCSKDKSIMITDMATEKLKKFYESAHDDAINKLHVLDTNLFATGDDAGTVKLWDLRTKHEVFALKEVEDYITQILTNDSNKLLLVTSGDGYLTTINIGARKLYVQSEPYEDELTCMGTFRGDSKLVVGTGKGSLYTFNYGSFGYHSDMYPGIKSPISSMLPITDRIACVAGEEGLIRACHIAPFRNLGIVGQHNMPVESLDINHSGELIASSSHNNDVRFWNVKYFEDFGDIKYNEKHNAFKEKRHNLPSSKFSNASEFFADLTSKSDDNE